MQSNHRSMWIAFVGLVIAAGSSASAQVRGNRPIPGGERLTTLPSTAPSTQLGDGEPLTTDETELTVIGEQSPNKVVKLVVENGVITVDSDLPPDGVFYLVRLKGVPGHGKVQVTTGRFATGARSVNLTH